MAHPTRRDALASYPNAPIAVSPDDPAYEYLVLASTATPAPSGYSRSMMEIAGSDFEVTVCPHEVEARVTDLPLWLSAVLVLLFSASVVAYLRKRR